MQEELNFDTSTTFLHEVWKIIRADRKDPHSTYIVLPGIRAGLYFKEQYKRFGQEVEILPQITAIHSFIAKFSPSILISNTAALPELYKVYQQNNEAQPYSEFMKWGQLLLNDFNEIDNYLVDAKTIYSNLRDLKAIEDWSFNAESLSEAQLQYAGFWDTLYPLYRDFQEHLESMNKAYSAMQVRSFAENQHPDTFRQKGIFCYFAGFNALNKAEEKIVQSFCNAGIGKVFWDGDLYYLGNPEQEAGKFFSFNKKDPRHEWILGDIKNTGLEIEITGVPKNIGQVKLVAHYLSRLSPEEQDNTVVILANENLLIPLLNSIPGNITGVNVTMGLPLRQNALYSLFESIFDLNLALPNESIPGELVSNILHHQFLHSLSVGNKPLNEWLQKKKYIVPEELISVLHRENLEELIPYFTNWHNNAVTCFAMLDKIIGSLRKQFINLGLGAFENEFLYETAKIIRELRLLVEQFEFIRDTAVIKKLFIDELRNRKVAIIGEPFKGLQVMGMLETRALDFKHIILAGANEGLMPAGGNENTLISYDLKKHYGLPTREKREAIYAYYVYRLLHRAKTVKFIYNNVADDLGGAEKSRYLLQMQHELRAYNPKIKITEKQLEIPADIGLESTFSVKKTPQIVARIKSLLCNGISPSAINTYLDCPLNFYYKYILRLPEIEDSDSEITIAEQGSLIHKVLEHAYDGMEGKMVTKTHIREILGNLDTLLNRSYKELFPYNTLQGKTLLSREIAGIQLRNYFEAELQRIDHLQSLQYNLAYLASEKEMEHLFALDTGEETLEVKIKGKIDRIEQVGNTITVIDYKTGKVDAADVSIADWNEITRKTKALQLAVYGLSLQKSYPGHILQAGIFSFMNLNRDPLILKYRKEPVSFSPEINLEIETALSEVFLQMLDPGEVLTHKEARYNFCCYCKS